ncbi:hypothetical protein GYMLUDRAFT_560117 [Collybiopsis luxurians FD-317 M1]|uniref:Uncharacterized protein n=1 Tax=Collybiopsis luxurians FD-317 M1 TaxID=944289 RepID=A0A0D0CRT1_9AGAR|nr:hypothetical protein GYMLUDRAFT_560117 [Collybiopsis luxurians FD-317 M1]
MSQPQTLPHSRLPHRPMTHLSSPPHPLPRQFPSKPAMNSSPSVNSSTSPTSSRSKQYIRTTTPTKSCFAFLRSSLKTMYHRIYLPYTASRRRAFVRICIMDQKGNESWKGEEEVQEGCS